MGLAVGRWVHFLPGGEFAPLAALVTRVPDVETVEHELGVVSLMVVDPDDGCVFLDSVPFTDEDESAAWTWPVRQTPTTRARPPELFVEPPTEGPELGALGSDLDGELPGGGDSEAGDVPEVPTFDSFDVGDRDAELVDVSVTYVEPHSSTAEDRLAALACRTSRA